MTPVKTIEHTSRNSMATEDSAFGIIPEAERRHPAIAMNNSRSGQQISAIRRAAFFAVDSLECTKVCSRAKKYSVFDRRLGQGSKHNRT
jgi:hypothetical protein